MAAKRQRKLFKKAVQNDELGWGTRNCLPRTRERPAETEVMRPRMRTMLIGPLRPEFFGRALPPGGMDTLLKGAFGPLGDTESGEPSSLGEMLAAIAGNIFEGIEGEVDDETGTADEAREVLESLPENHPLRVLFL